MPVSRRGFLHLIGGTEEVALTGAFLSARGHEDYTAQAQAIRTSGELLRDMGARFWDSTAWKLEVADERGQVLFVLRFSAEERPALTDPPPKPLSNAPNAWADPPQDPRQSQHDLFTSMA